MFPAARPEKDRQEQEGVPGKQQLLVQRQVQHQTVTMMVVVMLSIWQVSRGRAPEVRPPDARPAELQAAGGAGAEDRGAAALPLQDAGAGLPARLAQTRCCAFIHSPESFCNFLSAAEIRQSGISLYHERGRDLKLEEEGEVVEAGDRLQYDTSRLVAWPGFNADIPKEFRDDSSRSESMKTSKDI